MSRDRRLARTGGLIYLATFATSIPALALKSAYLRGEAPASVAAAGAVLEILLAVACVGTALALLPIIRRVSEPLAIGFVASRTVEAALILVGVLSLMSVVTLRAAGEDAVAVGFTALHDWAFLLGPALMSSLNAILLGTALIRGRLVPRPLPLVGLVGAPILLASTAAVLAGLWTQTSPIGSLSALPIALWELGLGLWLTVRGVAVSPARASG